jgi:hypothetical protein
VWVAFHHEPEGDGVAADWNNMQRRFSTKLKQYNNIKFTTVLTGYTEITTQTVPFETW